VSTIDPDEGKDPQAAPGSSGTESLRGPWESEPDTLDPDDPAQPEPGDDTADGDGDGEEEGEGAGSSMAPERGPWK